MQALDVALKHSASFNPECKSFSRAFFWCARACALP